MDAGEVEPAGSNDLLCLPDVFNIGAVGELHRRCMELLDGKETLVIDASGVETVDAAALQLLLALHREADKRGRPVSWKSASVMLRESARVLGVARELDLPEEDQ